MNKQILLMFFLMLSGGALFAQNVGIGTMTPDASAKLDITSANSGLLIPRIGLIDVTNGVAPVATPATGLLVYNTNAGVTGGSGSGFYYWDGTQWVKLDIAGGDWKLLGNAGTNPAVNFLGTTDNQDLVFRTNNTERARVLGTNGFVGINTTTPGQMLSVVAGNVDVNDGIYYLRDNAGNTYGMGYNTEGGTQMTIFTDDLIDFTESDGDVQIMQIQGNARRVEFFGTTDASGTTNTGVIEIANTLRLDGNEIITNTNTPLYLQSDNQGDLRVDGTTFAVDASANSVGVGTTAPDANAVMEIRSTTKGLLIPRLTTTQRDAMGGTLPEGLLIYNTTNNCIEFWDTQSTPVVGNNGFWNSLCEWCENIIIITASQTGFNLNSYVGGAQAKHYCVYIRSGVTLQAAANGGSGSAGNPGFNASTMPAGASVTLYNYGNILAGGGDGGRGGQESDAVCRGDNNGQNGGRGGHAIQTAGTVPVRVLNYGLIRAGGGGGGGGGASCCSAGGGGGGGAGTPAGGPGGTRVTECASGFVCGCGTSTSGGGNGGTATTGGTGGNGVNRGSTGCTCNGSGAGNGGTGGIPGIAGNNGGGTQRRGLGGGAGLALQGNGSGSSLTNFGTVTGGVNP